MTYVCELKEEAARPVLTVHTHSAVQNLGQTSGAIYSQLWQYLGEVREQPAGAPYICYHNMDMQNLDIEVGIPVSRSLPERGEIKPGKFPGGKFATCMYTGPYTGIGSAYDALTQWVNEKGYEPTGDTYERYLNDPGQTPPDKLLTQILYPLKGA